MSHITCSQVIPAVPAKVFGVACEVKNLAQLLCDHIQVEVTAAAEALNPGAEYAFVMSRYGLSQDVRLRITECKPGQWLTYKQVEGLFRRWTHSQRFEAHGENSTLLTDLVEYELPLGILGHLFDDLILRRDMQRVLEARLGRLIEMCQTQEPSAKPASFVAGEDFTETDQG